MLKYKDKYCTASKVSKDFYPCIQAWTAVPLGLLSPYWQE